MIVFADAYEKLPQYQVNRDLFDSDGRNLLFEAAKRTLDSEQDLIAFATGQKLLQANGICFAGEWRISGQSPYTGLYAANVTLPVLVRASVSLSGTKQKDKRAFAMAIKLFLNKIHDQPDKTLNLFLMHSLGGARTEHVLDLDMDNEPELGSLPPLSQWLIAYRLESDLLKADRLVSGERANARFRPVSHLAALDEERQIIENVKAPHWLRASPSDLMPRINKADFRDELQVNHYPGQELVWDLYGADLQSGGKTNADWIQIGQLVLNESIVSKSCDSKLHFGHPKLE